MLTLSEQDHPRISSGAAYAKVPATICVEAWSTSERILARPTSPILATPSCDRRMLDVFRSLRRHASPSQLQRWTTTAI